MSANNWSIEWYQCGDCKLCCYSWFFCPYAISEAKSQVDGSQFLLNTNCLSAPVHRWAIRTAYGIEGDACSDTLLTLCCPCCATNQMFQESNRRGMPAKEFAGYHNNVGASVTQPKCECSSCCYSFLCGPCAIGTGLERALGMPWWFGCCCVNSCMAHQLMRYQYRIKGNDVCDDYVMPSVALSLGYALSGITFGASFALILPWTVVRISHILQETEARGGGVGSGRYLFDTNAPANANVAGVSPAAVKY